MPDIDAGMPMIAIAARMVFSPFVISEPGPIKVRILREGLLHRLGSIQVQAVPVTMDNSTVPPPS